MILKTKNWVHGWTLRGLRNTSKMLAEHPVWPTKRRDFWWRQVLCGKLIKNTCSLTKTFANFKSFTRIMDIVSDCLVVISFDRQVCWVLIHDVFWSSSLFIPSLIANVPVTENALGRWVGTMRDVYKKYVNHGSIPANIDKTEMDRRIRLLEGLNFTWSLQDEVADKVKLD